MPFTIITGGSFTSAGVGIKLPMPSSPDYFKTENITKIGNTGANLCIASEWYGKAFGAGATPYNDGIRWKNLTSSAVVYIDKFSTASGTTTLASSGISYISTFPNIGPQSTSPITAITAANPAVVSQTNTYSNGDILQFYNTTGMLQIAGMNFQISSATGAAYTLIGLNSAAFATAGTAGYTRWISANLAVDPQYLYITGITQATNAVITTSVDPTPYYAVGMKVAISVPYSFGMSQINNMTGTITALSSASYTMTVNINSSTFSAFAFPASTASPTAPLFATLAPAGASTQYNPVTGIQTGYNFQYQAFESGAFVPYIYLGAGPLSPAGQSGDQINWMAYKLEA